MLTLIAAQDLNGAIGRGNEIPWHVPEDFAFFKASTLGAAVIMGRKTWDSLPRKPLPGRENLVVTRNAVLDAPGATCLSMEAALERIAGAGGQEIFCIGGAELYRAMMPLADRLLISTVELCVEGADAHFPDIDPDKWIEGGGKVLREAAPRCRVMTWTRRHTIA